MRTALKQTAKKYIYKAERNWHKGRSAKLTRPNFIYIGTCQGGSTWLFKNFIEHPNVFVANKKEVHYFSYAYDDWPFAYYCSLFKEAGLRVSGELTPLYMLMPKERIADVHKLLPDVQLLMTIRHPVERAWSGARRTLSQIAEEENTTLDQIPESEFYAYFDKEWAYRPDRKPIGDFIPGMLPGHYTRAIDNWLEFYPKERLKVMFFDRIKTEPQEFLTEVCQHIGASTDIDWDSMPLRKKINQNPAKPMPEKYRTYLTELYREEIAELKRRFPEDTKDW